MLKLTSKFIFIKLLGFFTWFKMRFKSSFSVLNNVSIIEFHNYRKGLPNSFKNQLTDCLKDYHKPGIKVHMMHVCNVGQ